jgi:hypothetical protein
VWAHPLCATLVLEAVAFSPWTLISSGMVARSLLLPGRLCTSGRCHQPGYGLPPSGPSSVPDDCDTQKGLLQSRRQ